VGCTGDVVCEPTLSGSACISNSPLPNYVLVVNVPEGAVYAPGEVFTFTPSQIACTDHDPSCAVPCTNKTSVPTGSICVQLPPLNNAFGDYEVASTTNLPTLGNPSTVNTTVPTQTSYVPTWSLTPPACAPRPCPPIEAPLLNLPLPTVFATALTPVVDLPSPGKGPEGTATTGWTALLPALSSGYVQLVNFTSPFDVSFPPWIQPPSAQLGLTSTSDLITVTATLLPTNNNASGPVPPIAVSPSKIDGWTAFLRDPTTRRIVSSQAIVKGGNASIQWLVAGVLSGLSTPQQLGNAMGLGSSGGYQIVLSPPQGSVGLPEFADSYVGGPSETYPDLPKPVTISGVVGSASAPVSATLHFVSTALYNDLPGASPPMCTISDSDAPLLHYDIVVPTDDQLHPAGALGKYRVLLPPGQYTITVEPSDASGFAKTEVKPQGDASSGIRLPPAGDPCTTAEATFDIPLEPLLDVTGQVLIADGRQLANATVDLTPSVVPPASTTSASSTVPTGSPRPFEVVTGADGSFGASVDPGTYDVTVRPAQGTNLPWIVSPAHVISGRTKIETLFVPAPAALSVTLHDPLLDLPLAQAVVRAYAFTSCSAPSGGPSCHGVALQIGQGFTDGNGSFEMFLTPFPFTPEKP
jgi:hypothetical protein